MSFPLDFLINDAWADAAAPAAGQASMLAQILPLGLLLVVFYFLLIRPQMKRAKEHRQMLSSIAKGDEVVTTGGVVGKVREIGENLIVLEIADRVEIRVQKPAVSGVLPKGTMTSL